MCTAFVITNNDSVEFVVVGSEESASVKLEELKIQHKKLYRPELDDSTYERMYDWELQKVGCEINGGAK